MSNQFQVSTSFGLRFDRTRDFPELKINTNQQLLWSLLTTRACGRRARLADSLANRDWGLSAFNSICSSYIIGPAGVVECLVKNQVALFTTFSRAS